MSVNLVRRAAANRTARLSLDGIATITKASSAIHAIVAWQTP